MKRACYIALSMLLAVGMAACGSFAPAAVANAPSTATGAAVTFADPVLEAMVRATIGKPEGDITAAEAEAVTRLNLSAEWWQQYVPQSTPITDISGLERFTNLEGLDLSGQAITDIAPLAGLAKLTSLSLGGNPVADIAPLATLTNLKWLKLTGCAAQDYTPLASLVNLNLLMLNQSTITDASPLAELSNLQYLFLADSQIGNYQPLAEIYPNLIQSDFTVSFSLAGLGFVMDNGRKQAIYDGDKASVRINHAEWGAPTEEWGEDSVRTVYGTDSGYKVDFGFYPDTGTYRILMNKNGDFVVNYLYDTAKDDFTFEVGDRASSEQEVLAALGDGGGEDVLLTPVTIFGDILKETVGIPADVLFTMPFDENTQLQPPYEKLGFKLLDFKGTYYYEESHINISVHRTELDENAPVENRVNWSVELNDTDIKGYQLNILYFADEGRYSISLNKGGEEARYDAIPATNQFDFDPRDIDTLRRMFNEAFGTQGDDFLGKPLAYFEQVVQERFGMSVEELFKLPM